MSTLRWLKDDNVTEALFDNAYDPDNFHSWQGYPLTWIMNLPGATLTLNDNTTGNFTYIANAGAGLDNFSYYVIDNYSVPSNQAYVWLR